MARVLSKDHLQLYKEGNRLGKLFKVIQNDPELSFEIRPEDTAMIYYRKKRLLEVKGGKIVAQCEPYLKGEELKVNLKDEENLNRIISIRNYFNQAKGVAYKESYGAEMELQQHIMLGNSSFEGRYVVVDMEWNFSQVEIEKENRIPRTSIDLVILDTYKNEIGKNDIYLAEIKLGTSALDGPSGLEGHVKKTYALIEHPKACESIVEDVDNIIRQKMELGIITGTPASIDYADKPKLMLILAYRSLKEKEIIDDKLTKISEELPSSYKIIYYNMLNRLEEKE